jgi:hypothetical protein
LDFGGLFSLDEGPGVVRVVWANNGADEYVGSVKGLSGVVWGVFLRICLRLRLILVDLLTICGFSRFL